MRRAALLALLAASCGPTRPEGPAPGDAGLEAFRRGDFEAAEPILRESSDPTSLRLLARVLLLRNRPAEALRVLAPLQPTPRTYLEALPEILTAAVRMDDFLTAAKAARLAGDQVRAAKYDALARTTAYLPSEGFEEARVPFVTDEPVPLVQASVNGKAGLFSVDTGVDELVLDRDFARAARVGSVGIVTGAFQKSFDDVIAGEVELGSLRVKNVPARLAPAGTSGRGAGSGVIGLAFLLHFDFTIDGRRQRLVLRRAGGPIEGVPAYVAGHQHLILRGRANGTTDAFVALRTGLGGVRVAASPFALQALGGELRELAAGPIRLTRPAVDAASFPGGLETEHGFTLGFMLGYEALRGRVLRLEPRSMRLAVE